MGRHFDGIFVCRKCWTFAEAPVVCFCACSANDGETIIKVSRDDVSFLMQMRRPRVKPLWGAWKWLNVCEWNWRRWGLGSEVSLEYWSPPEWSGYLHIGPLLLGVGIERSHYDEESR